MRHSGLALSLYLCLFAPGLGASDENPSGPPPVDMQTVTSAPVVADAPLIPAPR